MFRLTKRAVRAVRDLRGEDSRVLSRLGVRFISPSVTAGCGFGASMMRMAWKMGADERLHRLIRRGAC
jgi:hypothetical protein